MLYVYLKLFSDSSIYDFFCTLFHKVEELLTEIKETEEDVSRWREACELEVEAGKNVVEERDKVVRIKFKCTPLLYLHDLYNLRLLWQVMNADFSKTKETFELSPVLLCYPIT